MLFKWFKHSVTAWTPSVLIMLVMLIGVISVAEAAGTPAGTIIRSRSQVIYTTASGNTADTVYSAYVNVTVAQVGSVNMNPLSNASQTPSDSINVDYALTVANSGNGNDRIDIAAVSTKGWPTAIYVDVNGDGILQQTEIGTGAVTQTPSLAADGVIKLLVRLQVPRGDALDGVKDTIQVVARSNFDNAKSVSGLCITTIKTANLSPGSALTVDNPNPLPGTTVVFTLTLMNSGSVAAAGVNVTDIIPSGFTFISGSTTQGTFNGSTIPPSWSVGSIPPGSTVQGKLTLLVNSTVPSGSVLNNQFSIVYTVAGNTYRSSSNSRTVSIGGSPYGVGIVPYQLSLSKEPSDTAVYRFSIKNNGALKDMMSLNVISSRPGFAWSIFRDVNNNATLDAADIQIAKTDSIAPGDSVRVFARSIVPRLTANLLKDTLQLTAISSGDILKSASVKTVTTVNIPLVNLTETVSPAGNQPVGTVMTYTIVYSNTGTASVSNFTVSDVTSQLTSYVVNSVQLNGAALQDNNSNVHVTDDGNGNTVIGVNIGTLNAQTTGTVQFQVKIK